MNARRLTVALSLAFLVAVVAVTFVRNEDAVAPSNTVLVDPAITVPTRSEGGGDVGLPTSLPGNPAVGETKEPRDWMRSYHESADDFALARELLDAALLGDARAQYWLGQVLLRCEVYKRTLARYPEGTLATRVESYLASSIKGPEHHRSKLRREALRCAGLFSEMPFAGYDLPDEANDFRYWSTLAVESGDPIAVIDRALRSKVNHRPSDDAERNRAFRAALMRDVRIAVSSRDPVALFTVGGIFSDPSFAADPQQGYAWTVVACELGYDCTTSNPNWGGCVEAGTCVAGFSHADTLQRDLGATKYAQIYAQAQDIRYKLETDDWDGLQQYLRIKD